MFVKLAVLLATCVPVSSDGGAVPPPPPVTRKAKVKTVEETLRECEAIDRDVAATLKRADELFRLLGVTTPKLVPESRPDLLPNLPKK